MSHGSTHSFDGQTVTLHTDLGEIRLAFEDNGMLHLRRVPGRPVHDEDPIVTRSDPQDAALSQTDGTFILSNGDYKAHISLDPFSLSLYRQGALLVQTVPGRSLAADADAIILRLDYDACERIYGLGQDPMACLDHRDQERRMWNKTDSFRKSGNNGIPFYASSRGYGLFLNSFRPARFAIGKAVVADPPRSHDNDDPWPWDKPNPEANPREIAVMLDHPVLDVYLIPGGLDEVQSHYTGLTGRARLLPRWAFGLIQCKNRYRSMDELLGIARTFRAKGIPLDCLVIDWLWFKEFGDLTWDRDNFPDPRGGIAKLRALGVRFMLAQHPFIDRSSREYARLSSLGYLTQVPDSCRPTYDFSSETARAYWWDHEIRPLFDDGVRGYWTDMGEPEVDHPETVTSVGSRERAHNSYALNWSKALYEGQRRDSNERLFILGRALSAGIQQYSTAHWSNDIEAAFEVLADQVVQGQTVALSGQLYWCTDIGGFITLNGFSPELYIRWLQWGVFCTLFRTHGTRPDNEPWSFGPEAEHIIKDTILLRYTLLPYLYSCIWQAVRFGRPVVRAMALDFADDPDAVAEITQYMFGPSLLVAPVVREGERIRRVYLPKGIWYDFYSGARIEGGQYIDTIAPLSRIPVFVRAGGIVPIHEKPVKNAGDIPQDITVCVYPGAEGRFVLYDDDGTSYDYETGAYCETRLRTDTDGQLTVEHLHGSDAFSLDLRTYTVRLPAGGPAETAFCCDCNWRSNGTVTAHLVTQSSALDPKAKIGITVPDGWTGYLLEPERRGRFVVHRAKLRPVSDYLPVRHQAAFTLRAGSSTRTFPFAFGSGFASRFQILGDFTYTDGIETETPVEPFPLRPFYGALRWFRRYHDEFNAMGYVYCWREKIEDGPRPVAYAACSVFADRDLEAYIECSGDNEIRIWLNEQVVFSSRAIVLRQVLDTPVHLRKGKNSLLIKVAQNHPKPFSGRELGFSFRFTDEHKNPVPDLIYAPVL